MCKAGFHDPLVLIHEDGMSEDRQLVRASITPKTWSNSPESRLEGSQRYREFGGGCERLVCGLRAQLGERFANARQLVDFRSRRSPHNVEVSA
jgi:hypothetical protein